MESLMMMIILLVISINSLFLLIITILALYAFYFHFVQKNYTTDKKSDTLIVNDEHIKEEEKEESLGEIFIESINGEETKEELEKKRQYATYLKTASASGEITLSPEEEEFVIKTLNINF